MELILLSLIGLVVIVAVLASRLTDNSFPFPFDKKQSLFTSAENKFQLLLEQALGGQYKVVNRVKLADILTIRKGVSKKASQTALKNAENKYLDFVVCDRETMQMVGVIDLVDTQGKGYKVKKDWFVSGALEAAGISHVRIKVKATYTIDEIRTCLNARLLGGSPVAPKMAGKVIPAAMVKARSKAGVLTAAAAKAELANQALAS